MFGWIRRWWRGWEYDRGIFTFFDGVAYQRVDPLAIQRLLRHHGGSDWMSIVQALGTIQVKPEGLSDTLRDRVVSDYLGRFELIAGFIRKAFAIREFDKGGLTDVECLHILVQFLQFCRGLEDAALPLAFSVGSMASPESTSITPPSADSLSSPNGSSRNESTPSSVPSPIPSEAN